MISAKKLYKILPMAVLLVAIFSVLPYPGYYTDFITNLGNTTFWWIIQVIILGCFLISTKYFFDKSNKQDFLWVKWYLLYNLLSFCRGIFFAEIYWDWKALLANTFSLLVPIVAYAATNKAIMQSILAYFIRYGLPIFLIIAYLIHPGAYGFYLVPVSFLVVFFPVLPFRWKWIIMGLSILSIIAYIGVRSNVIKFGVPILLMTIYYFRSLIATKVLEIIRLIFFAAPFIFFTLGVTGTFNVFNMEEYVQGEYSATTITSEGEIAEEDLSVDTRTFLYIEVLQTAQKYNSWWLGRSPARGNETEWFAEEDITGRGERQGNEAAILNIFTWTGVIGIILYFLAFFRASYLAINKSNNIFLKILGIFIAFRWIYAWVEDINYFTLTTFMLWMMIGMCLSKSFREMTNEEVKIWVYGIFNPQYSIKYNTIIKKI